VNSVGAMKGDGAGVSFILIAAMLVSAITLSI
jgi:hypothetical protein